MAQVANSLPLPLTREHAPLSKKHVYPAFRKRGAVAPLSIVALELPLALSRPLGELPHVDPVEPEKHSVSAIFPTLYSASATTATCLNAKGSPSTQSVAVLGFDYGVALDMLACTAVKTTALPTLITDGHINITAPDSVKHCGQSSVSPMDQLKTCSDEPFYPTLSLKTCTDEPFYPTLLLTTCNNEPFYPTLSVKTCSNETASPAQLLKACRNVGYEKAVRPACEWIDVPIVEPPKPPDPHPCGLPPPSLKLPLPLRQKEQTNALMLHLPLTCKYKPTIPLLSTYMIYNEITATLDGQPIGLINPNISTNMDAFCWQLSVEIPYADYQRFNFATREDNPTLTLKINGLRWDIIIEEHSDSQAFINNRCTLKGRSKTAQLSGTEVMRHPTLILQSLTARQIIDKQLEFLPFTLSDYDAVDWLVPGNTYTQVGSPMDTILDIAKAGGNFVESHRFNPTLDIKKRWQVPAWQIKDQAPTLRLPPNVILSLDGTKNDNMRYNSVHVAGTSQSGKGGKVYRQLSNQTPEASILKHELYTDVAVLRSAGIAALSDTGEHTPWTIKTLLSDKHNVRLAELGEVLSAIGTDNQQIKGVVTGISVGIADDNNAPFVTQTISLDVYNGK